MHLETKEKFKDFVKSNLILLNHVKNGKMTWQQFYEIYDLYGEDKEAWKDYLNKENSSIKQTSTFDLTNFIKGLDLDGIQNGVTSLQRVLSLLQDMSFNKTDNQTNAYKPRPIYKHFDD